MNHYERVKKTNERLNDPNTVDNMEVRLRLMEMVKSGKITLEDAQERLKKIKKDAKRLGKQTAYGD